jgi:hypothetical protein
LRTGFFAAACPGPGLPPPRTQEDTPTTEGRKEELSMAKKHREDRKEKTKKEKREI